MIDPLEFAEWADAVLNAAAAHRVEAIGLGFTPEASEAMAVTLHSVLMASIYEGVDIPTET